MNILTYQNDWEADIYTINGKAVKTLKTVNIDGEDYAGTSRKVSVPYNDMGHCYTGVSTHYFVTKKVFGLAQVFDINTLIGKVKITPIKFTVEA